MHRSARSPQDGTLQRVHLQDRTLAAPNGMEIPWFGSHVCSPRDSPCVHSASTPLVQPKQPPKQPPSGVCSWWAELLRPGDTPVCAAGLWGGTLSDPVRRKRSRLEILPSQAIVTERNKTSGTVCWPQVQEVGCGLGGLTRSDLWSQLCFLKRKPLSKHNATEEGVLFLVR